MVLLLQLLLEGEWGKTKKWKIEKENGKKVKGSQNVLTSFSLGVTVALGTWRQKQEASIVLPVVFYN